MSHSQTSFTSGDSRAWVRMMVFPRTSKNTAQPTPQCVQTLATRRLSQGRDTKRYVFAVRAPTGQIAIVLPMNFDCTGIVNGVLISLWNPRSNPFSASSPAMTSPNRTHRQHRMQRSRSSTSTRPSETGLAKSRFTST